MKSFLKGSSLLLTVMLSSILIFTACSDDNYIIEDEIIEESDPDTLTYIFATGLVTDSDGNALSAVTIDYVSNDEINTITTDEQGKYELRSFEENSNRTTIRCHSEGFLPKVEVLLSEDQRTVEKDIILAREEEFEDGPVNQLSELDVNDELIVVSGRLVNTDGEGVSGFGIFVLDLSFTSFLYGITDQEGYWSVAVEPYESAYIFSYNPCSGAETLVENVAIQQDIDLGELETSQIEPILLNFSGFVTDCNTQEGLISGSIQFSFPGYAQTVTADIIKGVYDAEVPQCFDSECVDIKVFAFAAQSGVDTYECEPFIQGENIRDFEVCNEANPTSNGGFLSTIIDGVTTEYELVGAEEEFGRYLIVAENESEDRAVVFVTNDLSDTGTFEVAGIVTIADQETIYSASSGLINYQIDSITTEFMYGNYGGTIIDNSNGQGLPIEGIFKAKLP